MKLLINATILSTKNTGLGVYTYHVLKYIIPILESNNIYFKILVCDAEYLPMNAQKYALTVKFNNPLQRLNVIKRVSDEFDLLWSTTQHGVNSYKIKQIITIHDITPILYPAGRLKQTIYYKFILSKIIRKSSKIITVSNNTLNDIKKTYKYSKNKIIVIPPALPECNTNTVVRFSDLSVKYNIVKKKYFVITGIHYFYKNIQLVIEAFSKSRQLQDYKVIIIGNDKNKYGEYLKQLVNNKKLTGIVLFAKFVDNEEKETLLQNSAGAIYPSKYEGFGLPILEAMANNIPLFASNISSIPEVAKDYAFYFDPNDIDDFTHSIIDNIDNVELINQKIDLGKKYLMYYSWDRVANKIFDVIKEIMYE